MTIAPVAANIVVFVVFGFLAWSIYRDIKKQDGEYRKRKAMEYVYIGVGGLVLFVVLRFFFTDQMVSLYYWVTGIQPNQQIPFGNDAGEVFK